MIFGLATIEVFIIAGALIGIGFLIIIVAGVYKRVKSGRKEEKFEPEDIEDILKPEIQKMIEYWGSSTSIQLRYRYDVKGTVHKQLDLTADIEDEEKDKLDISIDQKQLKKDYEDGLISKRTYKMMEKFGQEKIHILLVRPPGFLNKIKWVIGETLLGGNKTVEKTLIIPERLLKDDVDYLTIDKEAEFRRFAGMDVCQEASSFNFVESVAFRALYEQSLEDQSNYHKQVLFFMVHHGMELQKLEKEKDIIEAQNRKGTAGRHNN